MFLASVMAFLLAASAGGQATPQAAAQTPPDEGQRALALYEAKKYDEAVRVLEAALVRSPKNPDLLFDLGLVLREKGDLPRAQESFEKELAIRPDDAEGHLVLARIHESRGERVPAVLAYLRFLSLEPSSDRTRGVVDTVQSLMAGGVEKDRHDPEKFVLPEKKGRDGATEDPEVLMAFIAAAAQYRDKDAPPISDAEKLVKEIQTFTGFLTQTRKVDDPFAAKTYLPFVSEMSGRGLVEPFGYAVAAGAGKKGGSDWVGKNASRVAEMRGWARSYRPAP